MDHFKLVSEYAPTGDQPQAIAELVEAGRKDANIQIGKRLREARQIGRASCRERVCKQV